jgi:hypothetical protein
MFRRKPEQSNKKKLTISEKLLRGWDISGRNQETPLKHPPAIFMVRAMKSPKGWSLRLIYN